jgi:hypothetical protein
MKHWIILMTVSVSAFSKTSVEAVCEVLGTWLLCSHKTKPSMVVWRLYSCNGMLLIKFTASASYGMVWHFAEAMQKCVGSYLSLMHWVFVVIRYGYYEKCLWHVVCFFIKKIWL